MKSKRHSKNRRGMASCRNPKPAIRQRKRRGILLLVVLSLLVLFLLIGTSFINSSDNYRKASKELARPYEAATNPLQQTDLLDDALNQLIRDTGSPFSSLSGHSLLGDLYGNDGLLIGPNSPNSVQFVDRGSLTFTFTGILAPSRSGRQPGVLTPVDKYLTVSADYLDAEMLANTGNQFFWAAVELPLNPTIPVREDFYRGRVFTLLDGPASGRSARVMRYFVDLTSNPPQALFYLMLVDSDRNFSSEELSIQPDHYAIINGQPFNGTGAGFSDLAFGANPILSAAEQVTLSSGAVQYPVALMPNSRFYDPSTLTNVRISQRQRYLNENRNGPGGADESYDAPDFQNFHLAWLPVEPQEVGGSLDVSNVVIPSYHRPALVNYWRNLVPNLPTEPSLLRKVIARPNWIDHQNFTGSNPEYERALGILRTNGDPNAVLNRTIYGPWDVDNDKDGRRDSMWVDAGFPVMEGPQGVLLKPLVAILCVDLDNRVNINAHGTSEMVGLQYPGLSDPRRRFDPFAQAIAGFENDPTRTTEGLAEGQGYGPAEIDPRQVLIRNGDDTGSLTFRKLLGDPNAFDANDIYWPGRYGVLSGSDPLRPGRIDYDLLAQLKQQGLPRRADSSAPFNLRFGNYASPPDPMGRYGLGLNALGQPVYEALSDPNVDLDINSPYELNLSRMGPLKAGSYAQDGPFTVAELERILRASDKDSGKLPSRLWDLADGFDFAGGGANGILTSNEYRELQEWRALLTTDSFSVPVPNVALPNWMRVGPDQDPNTVDDFRRVMGPNRDVNLTFADLLEYRVRIALGITNRASLTPANAVLIGRVMRQLLSPDLAGGQMLDLNRPFGNGRDDNFNGIVDEPGEWQDLDRDGVFDFDPTDPRSSEGEAPFWDIDQSRLTQAMSGSAQAFEHSQFGYFRDNIDRNGDGVIEPWERGDTDGDGTLSPLELVKLHNFRRQLYARHLYVLAMTLVDPLEFPPGMSQTDQRELREERARRLAQWAINVADFRDPDSISTAFEYDQNPYDGWGDVTNSIYIDGNLSTVQDPNSTGVVWGAEAEGTSLVITETLAWHDRRTIDSTRERPFSLDEPEDEVMDGVAPGIGRVEDGVDRSFDQEVRPEGAAFIELYNAAAQVATNDPNLIDPSDGSGLGIDLGAYGVDPQNPLDQSKWSPAWRILVYRTGGVDMRPDADAKKKRPNHVAWIDKLRHNERVADTAIEVYRKAERSIYFTKFDPSDRDNNGVPDSDWDPNDGVAFYSSFNVPSVRPGRYVVVAGVDPFTQSTNSNDPRSGEYQVKFGTSQDRGIWLRTDEFLRNNADPNKSAIEVVGGNGNAVRDSAGFRMKPPPESQLRNLGLNPFNQMNFPSTASVALIDRATRNSFYGKSYVNKVPDRTQADTRRFTFSEPADGYPDKVPVHRSQSVRSAVSVWNPATKKYSPVMDVPLDERRVFDPDYLSLTQDSGRVVDPGLRTQIKRMLSSGQGIVGSPTSMNDGETRLRLPEDDRGLRTLVGFRWIYLQRLRNPTLPWNPEPTYADGRPNDMHDSTVEVNPYMTVDVSGVNLTVFNGEKNGSFKGEKAFLPIEQGASDEEIKQARSLPPKQYSNGASMKTFASVQRGRQNGTALEQGYYFPQQDLVMEGLSRDGTIKQNSDSVRSDPNHPNLWSPEQVNMDTLWANRSCPSQNGFEGVNTGHSFEAIPDCTLGFLNEPYRKRTTANGIESRIIPQSPFTWFTWMDRDYYSSGELLLVPAFSTEDLPQVLSQINLSNPGANSPIQEVYFGSTRDNKVDLKLDGPFSHLMNFFRTQPNEDPNNRMNPGIAGMYRVLDYVHIPSRYVGTESWLSPIEFGYGDDNGALQTAADSRYLRQPPFNKVSNFRDPGLVNINTIGAGGSGAVWFSMFHGRTKYNGDPNQYNGNPGEHPAIDDDGMFSVRRGYGQFQDGIGEMDIRFPTLVANPFRAAGSANLVPLDIMVRKSRQVGTRIPHVFDVEATILRSMGVPQRNPNYEPGDDPNQLTFIGTSPVLTSAPAGVPLLSAGSNSLLPRPGSTSPRDLHWHSDWNSSFRYSPLRRLTSMSTTHSNVYAVWITVGFFEVREVPQWGDPSINTNNYGNDRAVYNRVYPEGYTFGKEYGIDTGEVTRLRQFAIVDRSIPVAYERGKNHNIERAIRLRRRIE